MTIWILAVLLLASLAGLGYRQGAIRVGVSFFGIIVGALLAVPLGRVVSRLVLLPLGVKDPLLVWALGPVIVFVLVSILFKTGAAALHRTIDVYYRYHAGDLRLALYERLNARAGLCLGLLNGAAYLVLLAFLIYVPSYLTIQVATSDQDPKWMRMLNTLGHDLRSTGMAKIARAIDRVPEMDYRMADFAALIYRNPLAEARLVSYPPFLSFGELPEFQQMGSDKAFHELWLRGPPVMELLASGPVEAIRNNRSLLKQIWNTVEANYEDLNNYLRTGRSAKYDPVKILGRWRFDVPAAVRAMRRAKANMTSSEMQRIRSALEAAFNKTILIAKPDNQVTLNNVPSLQAPLTPNSSQNLQGQWRDTGGKYLLSLAGMDVVATIEADRLSFKTPGMEFFFNRED